MSRKVASAVYLVFPCFIIFPSSRQSRLWSDSSPQKMPWFQVQVRTCTLLPPIDKEVRRRCCIFYFFLGTEPQAYLIIHHRQPHPSRSCILVGCFGTAWLPVWCFFLAYIKPWYFIFASHIVVIISNDPIGVAHPHPHLHHDRYHPHHHHHHHHDFLVPIIFLNHLSRDDSCNCNILWDTGRKHPKAMFSQHLPFGHLLS